MSQLKIKPKGKKKEAKALALPVIREDAAGIDIGATLIHVAVGPGQDEEPVRTFQTFTRDLKAIAVWLRTVGVKTVAMESTGVYWIPLYELLESEGFEVLLVNAHHVKRVPGRKTDVRMRSGCSICIRWDCCKDRFDPTRPFARFAVWDDIGNRWCKRPRPVSR